MEAIIINCVYRNMASLILLSPRTNSQKINLINFGCEPRIAQRVCCKGG